MRRLVAISVVSAVLSAAPALAGEYVVESGSTISYYVKHPSHDVIGLSSRPRGMLTYDPAQPEDFSGLTGKTIQVDWLSFDSGNASRDSNTRTVVGAIKFPTATVMIESVTDAVRNGNEVAAKLKARLYINGVKQTITAPLKVDLRDAQALKVAAKFTIKMTDFGIEPPSLLFIATDNEVVVEAALVLSPK